MMEVEFLTRDAKFRTGVPAGNKIQVPPGILRRSNVGSWVYIGLGSSNHTALRIDDRASRGTGMVLAELNAGPTFLFLAVPV